MDKIVWEMPAPATSVGADGPVFEEPRGRECRVAFTIGVDDVDRHVTIEFHDVRAYRCFFLGTEDAGMIRRAYGRLIEICESEWLAEVLPGYSRSNLTPARLRHFAIYFDDGPLYEVLCAEADVTEAC